MLSAAESVHRRRGDGRESEFRDHRAVVECLLCAHYTADEITEYLYRSLGVPEHEAAAAVRAVAAPSSPA